MLRQPGLLGQQQVLRGSLPSTDMNAGKIDRGIGRSPLALLLPFELRECGGYGAVSETEEVGSISGLPKPLAVISHQTGQWLLGSRFKLPGPLS